MLVILITNNGNSPLAGILRLPRLSLPPGKAAIEGVLVFPGVTATAVMEILYLLLRAGMEDSVEHIQHHEKAISPADEMMDSSCTRQFTNDKMKINAHKNRRAFYGNGPICFCINH